MSRRFTRFTVVLVVLLLLAALSSTCLASTASDFLFGPRDAWVTPVPTVVMTDENGQVIPSGGQVTIPNKVNVVVLVSDNSANGRRIILSVSDPRSVLKFKEGIGETPLAGLGGMQILADNFGRASGAQIDTFGMAPKMYFVQAAAFDAGKRQKYGETTVLLNVVMSQGEMAAVQVNQPILSVNERRTPISAAFEALGQLWRRPNRNTITLQGTNVNQGVTSSSTGGNATGGAGGSATGGNATGGNATGGNATGGNSSATGGNSSATGGNSSATGGNATNTNENTATSSSEATGGNATNDNAIWNNNTNTNTNTNENNNKVNNHDKDNGDNGNGGDGGGDHGGDGGGGDHGGDGGGGDHGGDGDHGGGGDKD